MGLGKKAKNKAKAVKQGYSRCPVEVQANHR
jgi:hypothetical protein